jgi:hypothetical protein
MLVKKLFLTHLIILGFHVNKEKCPFKISQELIDNDSYQLREAHEAADTAQKRGETNRKGGENLLSKGSSARQSDASKKSPSQFQKILRSPKN